MWHAKLHFIEDRLGKWNRGPGDLAPPGVEGGDVNAALMPEDQVSGG
jgi:hypothetical protein